MKKTLKKLLALMLAAVISVGTLPLIASATGVFDAELKIKAVYKEDGSALITITPSASANKITYTANGCTPTINSMEYTGPFEIKSSSLVRAAEFAPDGTKVAAKKKEITVTVKKTSNKTPAASTAAEATPAPAASANATADPEFSLSCAVGKTTVSISCADKNAAIYYTTDGSEPDGNANIYLGEFTLTKASTVRAVAQGFGKNASSVVSIKADVAVSGTSSVAASVDVPQQDGSSGSSKDKDTKTEKDSSAKDTSTKNNESGKTKNGLEPDTAEASKVTGKVRYQLSNMNTGGTYVAISTSRNGYTLYYTTDGSAPTKANGKKYTNRVKFDDPGYFRAYEYNTNGAIVSKLCIQIEPKCATPTMECIGYNRKTRTIVFTSATKDAEIYFTIDDTNPINSRTAIRYEEPMQISYGEGIRAIAIKDGYKTSGELFAYPGEAPYVLKDFNFSDPIYQRVADAINAERTDKGLKAVKLDEKITYAASIRAEELETYYDHTRPNGMNYTTVFSEVGIKLGPMSIVESTMVTDSVEDAITEILERRDTILLPKTEMIGIGFHVGENGKYIWSFLICTSL